MRNTFIAELIQQAEQHPEIFLIVGDLGFSVIEPFAKQFPNQFLNVGVAEQNMAGIASGLASEGYHVFIYSIGNFSTLRCFEQIRNDICYHNLPVTVVAVGGGLAYGNMGYSHHAVQDLALMTTLPRITVIAPGDCGEARAAVRHLVANPRPSYLRIAKSGEGIFGNQFPDIENSPTIVQGSSEVCVVTTGAIVDEAVRARNLLMNEGIDVTVRTIPILKPLGSKIADSLSLYKYIISVEEHVSEGGLGTLLRNLFPPPSVFRSLAVPELTCDVVGTQAFLRSASALDARSIAEAVKEALSTKLSDNCNSSPKPGND